MIDKSVGNTIGSLSGSVNCVVVSVVIIVVFVVIAGNIDVEIVPFASSLLPHLEMLNKHNNANEQAIPILFFIA